MRALRELCGEQCLPVPRLQLRRAKLGLVSYATLAALFAHSPSTRETRAQFHQQQAFIAASFKQCTASIAARLQIVVGTTPHGTSAILSPIAEGHGC